MKLNSIHLFTFALSVLAINMCGAGHAWAQIVKENEYVKKFEEGPNIEKKEIRGWLSLVANDLFNFPYNKYEVKKRASADYFTSRGYRSFFGTMENSAFLTTIRERQQTLSGTVISPIKITDPRVKNNKFVWTASFDYLIQYTSEQKDNDVFYQFLEVSVDIGEKGEDNFGKAIIGIDRWLSSIDDDPFLCLCPNLPSKEEQLDLRSKILKTVDDEDFEAELEEEEDDLQ